MCETGIDKILICFLQLEPEIFHKSKGQPNTGIHMQFGSTILNVFI